MTPTKRLVTSGETSEDTKSSHSVDPNVRKPIEPQRQVDWLKTVCVWNEQPIA